MTNIPSRCCTHAHSRQQGLISRTMKSERGVHKKDCTLAGAAAAGADYMAFAGVLRRAQVLANQWSAVHGLSAVAGRFQYMADVARALQVGLGTACYAGTSTHSSTRDTSRGRSGITAILRLIPPHALLPFRRQIWAGHGGCGGAAVEPAGRTVRASSYTSTQTAPLSSTRRPSLQ